MNSSFTKLMKKTFIIITLLTVGYFAGSHFYPVPDTSAKNAEIRMVPLDFSSLAESLSPAVVNIRTEKMINGGGRVYRHFSPSPQRKGDPGQEFFGRFFGNGPQGEFRQKSLGSGFIIDKQGYIVTNNHVIDQAAKIKVILKSGEEFDAQVIGRDPNTDLALIRIKSGKDLPVVNLGSSEDMKVGQWIIAIGSPFGLEHTVTSGIVSAKGRVIGSGPYDDFIQTDASINPGNSGGPMINMNGEVVGINTAIIAGGQGIGFAIPMDMAKGIIDQLKNNGSVTRGWLGVGIRDLSDEIAEYYGVKDKEGTLVIEVYPGDPAEKAGIRPQDIIIEVDGEKVASSRDLTGVIAGANIGKTVNVKVLRDGKEETFKVKIRKKQDSLMTS